MGKGFVLIALLAALACLAGCTLYGEHKVVNHWADATGGISFERSFWEDVKSKKWDELSRHVAGNYLLTTPQGTLHHDEALERLRHLDLKNYTLSEVHSELNGNTFVVVYDLTLEGTSDGKPLTNEPSRVMTVWQHQGKGWLAIARVGSY